MKGQTLAIIILSVLLLGTLGYMGYNQYTSYKQKQITGYATLGYQQAIVDVAQLASTCQQVPLVLGNVTINMIAVDCLQQARSSQ
jgi:predicted negative regulator of RcsB-dependent stress response